MSIERDILELQARVKALEASDRAGTWLDFVPISALQPFSGGGTYFYAALPRAIHTPRRAQVSALVATTNDGANYWRVDWLNADGDPIATVDTSASAANAWVRVETTTFDIDPLSTTADRIIQVQASQVGSPGVLSVVPMFYVL
jgi:hypothetical protein